MSVELTFTVHEIATDGLPDMDALVGRVAFIWDNHVISGWPVGEDFDDGGDADDSPTWEGADDVFLGPYAGVTHWIELPVMPMAMHD